MAHQLRFWHALLLLTGGAVALAQSPQQPVQLRGNASITAELYTNSGALPEQRYRPRYTVRAFANPQLVLFGTVTIPLELSWSSSIGGIRSPFAGMLQPFNQFGLSPQLTPWLRLHGGYFSLQLSELTFGELRPLGGGIELSPGPLRLAALYGVVQHPRAADSSIGFAGAYRRWVYGGSLGYEAESGASIRLSFVRLTDDTASIRLHQLLHDTLTGRTDTVRTPALDNAVAALSFQIPAGSVRFSGELALSGYTSNRFSPEKSTELPRWLFPVHYSSNLDGAAKAQLSITPSPSFTLALSGQWIGPGFYTLGYPQLYNDVMEVTVSPALSLVNNTLALRFSAGLRLNNLRSTRLATTRRLLAAAGASWNPTEQFGVDVQYSNFGTRMEHSNDTLRVQNTFQSFTLAPRLLLRSGTTSHLLSLTYSFSDADDRNPFTRDATRQQTHSAAALHTVSFPSTLSLSSALNFSRSNAPTVRTELWSLSETVSYSFIPGKLSGSAGIALTQMRTSGAQLDSRATQLGLRTSLSYRLQQWGTLSWTSFVNRYSRQPRGSTEFHTSLNYSVGL